MRVIQFNRTHPNHQHFITLCREWWLRHYSEDMTHMMMTDYGFMALNGNWPVFAGFFYPTMGTTLCIWGFQVSNPDASKREIVEGFELVATAVCEFAKSLGYEGIVCYPRPKALQKLIKRAGFKAYDQGVTQYCKEL